MEKLEIVSLDDMDWFEFQRFTAHLFEKLGFGNATEILRGNDAGRDVTLHSRSKGLTIIECKHHSKGSIGRPVVQKLHSALITANANRGFLVTTGRFSANAIEYARNLEPGIELVDLRVLNDMAKRAEIKFLKQGESTAVFHVLPPSKELIEFNMLNHVIGNAISHPSTPIQLATTEILNTKLVPTYMLKYSLNQTFSTTVGVVHRENIDDGRLLIDATDGSLIKPKLGQIVKEASMVEGNCLERYTKVYSDVFKIGYSTAKRKGVKHIQDYHTKTVGYYGGNNVHYTKRCRPNISSVFVKSFTQVYIPIIRLSFQILFNQKDFSICGNNTEIQIVSGIAGSCDFCGKEINKKSLLCNSCGNLVHSPKFRGHSYFCEECKKTICKECTYWTRKYVILKKKLCEDCGTQLQKKGKKIKKMIIEDLALI